MILFYIIIALCVVFGWPVIRFFLQMALAYVVTMFVVVGIAVIVLYAEIVSPLIQFFTG